MTPTTINTRLVIAMIAVTSLLSLSKDALKRIKKEFKKN
jgi:hypothetical protein